MFDVVLYHHEYILRLCFLKFRLFLSFLVINVMAGDSLCPALAGFLCGGGVKR